MAGRIDNAYNVPEHTFVATILCGAAAGKTPDKSNCILRLLQPSVLLPGPLSTQIKKLIWAYAGVKSGAKWGTIKLAAHNLGIDKGKQPSL